MKNILYISVLLLAFSCGGEAKTDNNSAKTASLPTETEQNQTISDVKDTPISKEGKTKVLAESKIEEEVTSKETTPDLRVENVSSKPINSSKSKTEKNTKPSTVKNEAEAKAQLEAEKAKSLAEKMHLEEEMKKAEEAKQAKQAAAEKARKERENGDLSGSGNSKPTSEAGLHDEFDTLLKKYVSSSGKVNYKGLKNVESKLDSYLQKLESTIIQKSWSRNKELAFWINAYNAYTIKLILKNYPVKSIMDLNNGKPWDVKWIKIDQKTLSLNNIENDIIRPKFNEPRIHFAVNCAAKSCPPLLNKAWTSNNLNTYFDRQTKSFINNSNYNSITSSNIEISKIFDWYGKDFGDLRTYLNKYSNTQISSGTSINFKSYNWDLNN
jgi:hypothetical protein